MKTIKTDLVPILFFYELTDEQARTATTWYGTEENACEHQYIQAWDVLIPLEKFTHISNDYWHGSLHLTNSCSIVIQIMDCGTQATIGLIY